MTPERYSKQPESLVLRLTRLEATLRTLQGYAQDASHQLALQLNRYNRGLTTTPWEPDDVVRVLDRIAGEAGDALAAGRPQQPAAKGGEA